MYGYGYSYPSNPQGGGNIPTAIPDLGLWLKADAGITLVGGAVDAWADQSGNGRNFSAPGATNRPAYSGTLNGLPVLTFDGSTDYLQGNAASLNIARNVPGLTVICVVQETVVTASRVFAASRNDVGVRFSSGSNGTAYVQATRREDGEATATTLTGGTTSTSAEVRSYIARYSVATGGIFVNGVSQVDTAMGTAGNTTDGNSLVVYVGAGTTIANFFQGHIAELIVYRRAITPNERNQVENYLRHKWAI